MLIKNTRVAHMSNYEVLELLNERQAFQKEALEKNPLQVYPEHLCTIQFEMSDYLKSTPCSTQTPQQVKAFLTAMKDYILTKAEKLQILNLRPKSVVELYLLIEECEERFTEEALDTMLTMITTTLERDDDEVYEEGEGEEEE
ncbi:RNA polymerase Rpb4-domain-containing protein [Spinellus fusiger]|nr:RNA polymerase Rpb4-domain-containing protein [Spinellus fusiger]